MPEALSIIEMVMTSDRKHCRYDKVNRFLDQCPRSVQLVDHREDLVAERTRIISRLRWHLHELDPAWRPPTKLDRTSAFDKIGVHVATFSGLVADLTVRLVDHLRRLTTRDR